MGLPQLWAHRYPVIGCRTPCAKKQQSLGARHSCDHGHLIRHIVVFLLRASQKPHASKNNSPRRLIKLRYRFRCGNALVIVYGSLRSRRARARAFGNRHLIGIAIGETDEQPDFVVKDIDSVIDERRVWSDDIWQLIQWSADYYHHSLGDVAANTLPVLLRKGAAAEYPATEYWQLTEAGREITPEQLKRAPKQQQLLELLATEAQPRSVITAANIGSTVIMPWSRKAGLKRNSGSRGYQPNPGG